MKKPKSRDYFQLITNTTYDEIRKRHPTAESTVDRLIKTYGAGSAPLTLGLGADEPLDITESDRSAHMHIMGRTGQGKSRLLEMLMRRDIDQGQGFCFIDGSDGAGTLKRVLAYCALNNHPKVCLIDPSSVQRFGKACVLNPLPSDKDGSLYVESLIDAFAATYNVTDQAETPRLRDWLSGIFKSLHAGGYTLQESRFFTLYSGYKEQRNEILSHLGEGDSYDWEIAENLSEVYSTPQVFRIELGSTIRRLKLLHGKPMRWMLGSNEITQSAAGNKIRHYVNFQRMISEGWVVLVNCDQSGGMGQLERRLLGAIVANSLTDAIHSLRAHDWQGAYYLYVDEAGLFAGQKIAQELDYKRQTGLRFVMAHQYLSQFDDHEVRQSILTNAEFKIVFNTGREDRDIIARELYGGELSDRDVAYALGQLKKRYAVMRVPRLAPQIRQVPDVNDLNISREEVLSFEQNIYNREWYKTPEQIEKEARSRFDDTPIPTRKPGFAPPQERANSAAPRPRKKADNRADSPPRVPRPGGGKDRVEDVFQVHNDSPANASPDGSGQAD